jgi:hypothetical protein
MSTKGNSNKSKNNIQANKKNQRTTSKELSKGTSSKKLSKESLKSKRDDNRITERFKDEESFVSYILKENLIPEKIGKNKLLLSLNKCMDWFPTKLEDQKRIGESLAKSVLLKTDRYLELYIQFWFDSLSFAITIEVKELKELKESNEVVELLIPLKEDLELTQ